MAQARDRTEWTAVVSSHIRRVGYEHKTRRLYIDYEATGVYVYLDVPPEVYGALMKSESKGGYVKSVIKRVYKWEKVEPAE